MSARSSEFDVRDLQYHRLFHRFICMKHGLTTATFDLLLYLYPIKLFSKKDFQNGSHTMSWNQRHITPLVKAGYIKVSYNAKGQDPRFGRTKYNLTLKARRIVREFESFFNGADLPIKKPKNYTEKIIYYQAEKYNKLKYKR